MSRLRMASGMAAAFAEAARGPVGAVRGFIWAMLRGLAKGLGAAGCAVGRGAKVVLPILFVAGAIAMLYMFVCNWIAQARVAAEATKHETAFNEYLVSAADEAEDLEINERIRVMVGSRLGAAGETVPGSDKGREISSLEGVPDEPMEYRELTVKIASPIGNHTVRLMAMRSSTGREYVSAEVDGELAYMCAVERDAYGDREDLWPWVYKGIGLWEHLLDQVEATVDRDRQQQEIDSRFGNLETAQTAAPPKQQKMDRNATLRANPAALDGEKAVTK